MEKKKKNLYMRVLEWVVKGANTLGCGCTAFLMVFITCDVVGRFVFNAPITGTTELAISLITVICFLQAVYVQYEEAHLNVNILSAKFPPKLNLVIKEVGYVISLVVFFIFAKSSYNGLMESLRTHETEGEGALVLPMWPVRLVIVLCCVLMMIVIATQVVLEVNRLKTGETKHAEGGITI